jgi:hypothetical protein
MRLAIIFAIVFVVVLMFVRAARSKRGSGGD